ncbi:MAG TPA: SIR2 family protein [Acidimicrobiales bacterium]|nr:SIR2 family protein [Acidimicrobiales bacterium]
MRKIDYVLRLADPALNKVEDIVRKALYEGKSDLPPSPLAEAVGSLVSALGGRAVLLTTNYDDQLERGLETLFPGDAICSLALTANDLEEWRTMIDERGLAPVLHMHGMVSPTGRTTKVVLSEARFHEHRQAVQQLIAERLTESHVVLLGVSMTDPNLSEPLNMTKGSRGKHQAFLLHVPEYRCAGKVLADEFVSREDVYVGTRNDALKENYGLSVITLKSFAQVQQVLNDLVLAQGKPAQYFNASGARTTRYGYRLKRALDYSYLAVGIPKRHDFPEGRELKEVSDKLDVALEAPHGPRSVLRKAVKDLFLGESAALMRELGFTEPWFRSEGFALFLWLRARAQHGDNKRHPPFALRLIGTSAYHHRRSWSHQIASPIQASQWMASNTAFYGRFQMAKLVDHRAYALWRSAASVPITWVNENNRDDRLAVGVLTLHSNRQYWLENELRELKGRGIELKPSVLGLLNQRQRIQLEEQLSKCGSRIVKLDRQVSRIRGVQEN